LQTIVNIIINKIFYILYKFIINDVKQYIQMYAIYCMQNISNITNTNK